MYTTYLGIFGFLQLLSKNSDRVLHFYSFLKDATILLYLLYPGL